MQEQLTSNTAPSVKLPSTLSRDPDKAIEEMIATIARLQNIYERETLALENIDAKGFLAEQEEKFEAAQVYQAHVQDILQRREELRSVNPALKNKLEKMQADFSEMSFKNMNALKRMQRTMDRLGNTIRRIAKEETKKQRTFSYGSNGTLAVDRKSISMGVSETA